MPPIPHADNSCYPPNQAAGPSPCYLLPLVLRGGKTMDNGKINYSGAIRSIELLVCVQRALGYWFVKRFTIDGAPFPDPNAFEEDWLTAALFPGQSPQQNVSYEQTSCVSC